MDEKVDVAIPKCKKCGEYKTCIGPYPFTWECSNGCVPDPEDDKINGHDFTLAHVKKAIKKFKERLQDE